MQIKKTPTHRRRLELLTELSIPLIAGVVCALVWANAHQSSYRALIAWSPLADASGIDLRFAVNELFMTLFFGIAAKEISESFLPGGALNPLRAAVNPLFATVGGVAGPALVYVAVALWAGDDALLRGWGIPTATDIAIAWLVARVVFGARHPAVRFLLLLAIVDDGIGLAIIAIFYPNAHHPVRLAYLGIVLLAVALAYTLRRLDVRNYFYYLALPGALSWAGLHAASLHPALALVVVVPFMPSAERDEGLFAERSGVVRLDTLNRFERAFKVPVDVGLFGFGIANAGVELAEVGPATWAVLLGLVAGKTIGIYGMSTVACALGFALPAGMTRRALFIASLIGSLGLTVALFVAGVAFQSRDLQAAAKMGALLSAAVAPVAVIAARALRIRRLPD